MVIIEGRQEDRRPELPLVQKIVGQLVIGVDPDLEPGENDLAGTDVEVVIPLRLCGRVRSAEAVAI